MKAVVKSANNNCKSSTSRPCQRKSWTRVGAKLVPKRTYRTKEDRHQGRRRILCLRNRSSCLSWRRTHRRVWLQFSTLGQYRSEIPTSTNTTRPAYHSSRISHVRVIHRGCPRSPVDPTYACQARSQRAFMSRVWRHVNPNLARPTRQNPPPHQREGPGRPIPSLEAASSLVGFSRLSASNRNRPE